MSIRTSPPRRAWSVASTDRVGEVMAFHVVCAAFLLIVGYVSHSSLLSALGVETTPATGELASTAGETWFIVRNNGLFFLAVSLLPVLNLALFAPQFFNLGGYIYLIQGVPPSAQFDMLYRHTILEVMSLLVAVWVSYTLLFAIMDFTRSATADRALLRRRIKTAACGYPIIILLTVAGALLEGGAVVHL